MKVLDVSIRERSQNDPDYKKTVRMYFWLKNENILQNMVRRRNRPYEEYRTLFPQVFEILKDKVAGNITLEQLNDSYWSQKAGCRCGCSPGFITHIMNYCDFHIDIEA